MTDTKVGTIDHYYDKLGVVVVHVLAPIKVGDKIKIVSGDTEFEQEVKSMQIERKDIQTAKKGDDVGMKIDQPVKKGEIYKVA